MFSSVTLSSGPYQRNDNFIVSSVLRKVLSAHVIFACIHVYDIAPCTFLCFFFLTISCLYTSVNIHLSFFLFCIIFCICFVYYSQFTPVFPQVLLFLLLYTSGYFPADFFLFHFLAPRSARLKFRKDFLSKSARIPSTVLHCFSSCPKKQRSRFFPILCIHM